MIKVCLMNVKSLADPELVIVAYDMISELVNLTKLDPMTYSASQKVSNQIT